MMILKKELLKGFKNFFNRVSEKQFHLFVIGVIVIVVPHTLRADPVVLSGDAIEIANSPQHFSIFLYGIDAPDPGQSCVRPDGKVWPCGEVAKNYLRRIMVSQDLRCQKKGIDEYGRLFSTCILEGSDLGKSMVRAGYAVVDREQSSDYLEDEDYARSRKLGIWNGSFTNPWEWRKEHNKKRW